LTRYPFSDWKRYTHHAKFGKQCTFCKLKPLPDSALCLQHRDELAENYAKTWNGMLNAATKTRKNEVETT